mmetsp:Transcript_14426/g.60187  ORF Transcript_14426/g.60187 Transcript_14426/m.60187 type:complete len:220 (-) Transcript_14426:679-1338(-)
MHDPRAQPLRRAHQLMASSVARLFERNHAREEQHGASEHFSAARRQPNAHVGLRALGIVEVRDVGPLDDLEYSRKLPLLTALVHTRVKHRFHLWSRTRIRRRALAASGRLAAAGVEMVPVDVHQIGELVWPHHLGVVNDEHRPVVGECDVGRLRVAIRRVVLRYYPAMKERAVRIEQPCHLLGVRARAHRVHAELKETSGFAQKSARPWAQLGPHADMA